MTPEAASDAPFALYAAIGFVVALAIVVALWLRARTASEGDGVIHLVSVRSLGGKRLVALVEVEQQRFLLGMTDESISCLGRLPRPGTAHRAEGATLALAEPALHEECA